MKPAETKKRLRIGFVHPDLGIGGAERLVVDAALALQKRGHDIVMFTSRHDHSRCFEETRNGSLDVHVLGSSLPRSLHPLFPLTIIFSLLRSILLSVLIITSTYLPPPASFLNPLSPLANFDVWIVDQQSVCVPLLKWIAGGRVVFYCHFPDKLLSGGWEFGVGEGIGDGDGDGTHTAHGKTEGGVKRRSGRGGVGLLKTLYRWPIDKLEELTTGQADVVVSNSQFTSQIYVKAFPSLSNRPPKVVYPCIDLASYESFKKGKSKAKVDKDVELIRSSRRTFVSLNRFEEKKNIDLAIKSYAGLEKLMDQGEWSNLRLVIGGGYDDSLPDNVETLQRLQKLCTSLHLVYHTLWSNSNATPTSSHDDNKRKDSDYQVLFIPNFSTSQRTYLLTSPSTIALLYTPSNEHFGIVPLEAGGCGKPVIAVNSGGPLETIVDLGLAPPPLPLARTPTQLQSSVENQYNSISLSNIQAGTGLLLPSNPEKWSQALHVLLNLTSGEREEISQNAIRRIKTLFSSEKLGEELENICRDVVGLGDVHDVLGRGLIWYSAILIGISVLGFAVLLAAGRGM